MKTLLFDPPTETAAAIPSLSSVLPLGTRVKDGDNNGYIYCVNGMSRTAQAGDIVYITPDYKFKSVPDDNNPWKTGIILPILITDKETYFGPIPQNFCCLVQLYVPGLPVSGGGGGGGTVSSVNGQLPDANGAVTVTAAQISYTPVDEHGIKKDDPEDVDTAIDDNTILIHGMKKDLDYKSPLLMLYDNEGKLSDLYNMEQSDGAKEIGDFVPPSSATWNDEWAAMLNVPAEDTYIQIQKNASQKIYFLDVICKHTDNVYTIQLCWTLYEDYEAHGKPNPPFCEYTITVGNDNSVTVKNTIEGTQIIANTGDGITVNTAGVKLYDYLVYTKGIDSGSNYNNKSDIYRKSGTTEKDFNFNDFMGDENADLRYVKITSCDGTLGWSGDAHSGFYYLEETDAQGNKLGLLVNGDGIYIASHNTSSDPIKTKTLYEPASSTNLLPYDCSQDFPAPVDKMGYDDAIQNIKGITGISMHSSVPYSITADCESNYNLANKVKTDIDGELQNIEESLEKVVDEIGQSLSYQGQEIQTNTADISTLKTEMTTKGEGTVKSVNNTQPDSSGNVDITIPTPSAAAWGNITGTLANQADLQSALNKKSDIYTADGTVADFISNGKILKGNGVFSLNNFSQDDLAALYDGMLFTMTIQNTDKTETLRGITINATKTDNLCEFRINFEDYSSGAAVETLLYDNTITLTGGVYFLGSEKTNIFPFTMALDGEYCFVQGSGDLNYDFLHFSETLKADCEYNYKLIESLTDVVATKGSGTVKSVNNTQPDSNGNVVVHTGGDKIFKWNSAFGQAPGALVSVHISELSAASFSATGDEYDMGATVFDINYSLGKVASYSSDHTQLMVLVLTQNQTSATEIKK